jgi:hypothetical protein
LQAISGGMSKINWLCSPSMIRIEYSDLPVTAFSQWA